MRGLTPIFVVASLVVLGAAVWWATSEPEPLNVPAAAPLPSVEPPSVPVAPVPRAELPAPTPTAAPLPSPELPPPAAAPPSAPTAESPFPRKPSTLTAAQAQTIASARALLEEDDAQGALRKLQAFDHYTVEAEVLRAEAYAQLGDGEQVQRVLKKLAAEGYAREAKAVKAKLAR